MNYELLQEPSHEACLGQSVARAQAERLCIMSRDGQIVPSPACPQATKHDTLFVPPGGECWGETWPRRFFCAGGSETCQIPAAAQNRQRGDPNPCGQSPIDFQSVTLTTRSQWPAWPDSELELVARTEKFRSGLFTIVGLFKPMLITRSAVV